MTSLFPATIGDETPPGAGTFHLTFCSGPNSVGGFWPSATPDPFGPRNRGQTSDFSVAHSALTNVLSTTKQSKVFIMISKSSKERIVNALNESINDADNQELSMTKCLALRRLRQADFC